MSVRQLMEAEATRIVPGSMDLWPRVAHGLAVERRRARQRRLGISSVAAALVVSVWLGMAPVGGWLPGATMTVVPTAQAAEGTPVPLGVATAASATATATQTPRPLG